MSDKPLNYAIDEFASYKLEEDNIKEEFTIIIKGNLKYRHMIAEKIGELSFSDEDLKKWEDE